MQRTTPLQRAQLVIAVSLAAMSLSVSAQTAQPTSADAQQPAAAKDTSALQAAFKRADKNGDGKLSREEAAALPAIAQKFDQLDKDNKGYVTFEELSTGMGAEGAK